MESQSSVKVFPYRWIILLIYCLYAAINFVQFIQYSIISNITMKYYDVDDTLVDLNGLIFMISFVIFCLPFNYLIEKYNLKTIAVISSGLTTLGNLIKLLSIARDRFYIVLIGQFLCAIGQVFILSIPAKLASTWFGPGEVSTACAIAILGTQVGVAVGCIWSSNQVKNSDNFDDIGTDFLDLNIINASVTCAIFALVLIFFRPRPPLPPSQSQVNIIEAEPPSTLATLKAMFTSKDYICLLLAIGGSNGMYTCFGILINNVYLHYFPDSESELGIITAMAVIAGGCIGSIVFGVVLDKWHKFKLTTFFIIIGSTITYIFVALTLEFEQKLATYFTIPIFGFFVASTLLIGFEYATEIMYPIPEASSCSVLNSVIFLFTIIYTLIFEQLFDAIGYLPTHAVIVACMGLSSVPVYFISPKLHRREANINAQ